MMKNNTIDLVKIIHTTIEAGTTVKEVYNTKFTIEKKEDKSPLTIADTMSHKIITYDLKKLELPIMSEEGKKVSYNKRKNWTDYWLVDPLDGTKEFIKRNDEFTINIALINNQLPVLGIIYVPVLDLLYWAQKEIASFKLENVSDKLNKIKDKDNLIELSTKLPIQDKPEVFTIVASRSHMSDETQEYIEKMKKKHKNVTIMSKGSSLKLCMIAEGLANAYPRFAPTYEWDTAAGQAIVEYAGGKVLQINERDKLIYNKKNLINPWFIAKR